MVGEIMYFVQDFEPAFYAMGSEYILAENTVLQYEVKVIKDILSLRKTQ